MLILQFFLAGIGCLVDLRIGSVFGSGGGGLKTRAVRSLRGNGGPCQSRKIVGREDRNIVWNEAAAADSDNVSISEDFSGKRG
jgi:hypothetical protein